MIFQQLKIQISPNFTLINENDWLKVSNESWAQILVENQLAWAFIKTRDFATMEIWPGKNRNVTAE